MAKSSLTLAVAFVLTALSAAPRSASPQVELRPLAIENVTVIPMEREGAIADQTVVIEGRRIREIGPAGAVLIPANALRIDGSGKFLIPGLAEMHAHLPSPQAGEEHIDRVLFLFLANGITTVRGMLGHPYHLQLRAQVASGQRLGPQIFTSGPSLNGRTVPDAATARRLVTEQRAAGYDLLKIHPGISREAFDTLAATARAEGIPFAGHVPADVGLLRALEAGLATVEHLDGYVEALLSGRAGADTGPSQFFGYNFTDQVAESRIEQLASETRVAGTWVTPTQVLFENRFLGDPQQRAQSRGMEFMGAATVQSWIAATERTRAQLGYDPRQAQRFIELRRQLIKALNDAGVGILLGADAPQVFNVPGYATLQELGALVEAGLTPYEALVAGTRNPAVHLGRGTSFGTVAVGKRADLVLLEANPLAEISNVQRIAGVVVAGRWLSASDINERLQKLTGTP